MEIPAGQYAVRPKAIVADQRAFVDVRGQAEGRFGGGGGLSRMDDLRLERVKGIEPSYEAWEAAVLPLNYTRIWRPVVGRMPAVATRVGV